jgi:4-hydroxybenzoate polyprenyltransferase
MQATPILRPGLLPLIQAARPFQAAASLLVFAPMLAAHVIDRFTVRQALAAFVVMVLCSAGGALLRDGVDALEQRASRPFPVWLAVAGGVLAYLAAAYLAWRDGRMLLLAAAAHGMLSLAYAAGLKRVKFVRIVWAALLLSLPVLAGSGATGIAPPVWLLAGAFVAMAGVASWRAGQAPPPPATVRPPVAAAMVAAAALVLVAAIYLR